MQGDAEMAYWHLYTNLQKANLYVTLDKLYNKSFYPAKSLYLH